MRAFLPSLSSLVRQILLESPQGEPDRRIFMHIAGPAGSGKTTLLRRIEAEFPGRVACIDLDDFDDAATAEMGLRGTTAWAFPRALAG